MIAGLTMGLGGYESVTGGSLVIVEQFSILVALVGTQSYTWDKTAWKHRHKLVKLMKCG